MSNDVGHRIFSRLAFSQALDEEILLISSIGNFLAKISNPANKPTYVFSMSMLSLLLRLKRGSLLSISNL